MNNSIHFGTCDTSNSISCPLNSKPSHIWDTINTQCIKKIAPTHNHSNVLKKIAQTYKRSLIITNTHYDSLKLANTGGAGG